MVSKREIFRIGTLFLFGFIFPVQVLAANVMNIQGGQVAAGNNITIQVSISNDDPFIAFQLDIPLPSQLNYVPASAALDPSRSNGHSLSAQVISGNILRIFAYSLSNATFFGNTGSVLSFQLQAGTLPGDYTLNPVSPIIAGTDGSNILTSANSGTVTLLAPDIQPGQSTIEFGETPLGTYTDRIFTLSNPGNQTLDVSGCNFNSPFFSLLGPATFSISPGGSIQLTIRFSASEKGSFSKTLTILSNDPDTPSLTINLEAVAFAVNELHAGSMLSFSGQDDTLSFSINNMEAFVAFQFDLILPEPLNYIAGSARLSIRKTDHQVSAAMINENTLRVVAFSPTNQPFTGNEGEILELAFHVFGQGGWYPLSLSQVIMTDLSGLNLLSAAYNGSLEVAAPDIQSASNLEFGDVPILETASRMLRIYNYGTDVLNISGVQITNPVFFILNAFPVEISQGNFFDLEVIYQNAKEGEQSGFLKIFSDDPDTNPFEVSLSANSIVPNTMNVVNAGSFAQDQIFVEINVDNHDPFVAFEFYLLFPRSIMNFLTAEGSSQLTARAQDHVFYAKEEEDGVLRVFAYSPQQLPFNGNTGPVIKLGFSVDAPSSGTQHELILKNPILASSLGENILYSGMNGTLKILAAVECPEKLNTCLDTDPFRLDVALPAGGAYSGAGVTGGFFDPFAAGLGTHAIRYDYKESQCYFNINVNENPIVEWPLQPGPVFASDAPLSLTGGIPEGGVYSGVGVYNNIFYPYIAGEGVHVLNYTYNNSFGCSHTATAQIEVIEKNTWTGSISNNWNLPGNWTKGFPTSDQEVIILPGLFHPIISGENEVTVNGITIKQGTKLEIGPAGKLSVVSHLENEAGKSGIIIKSAGSLIHHTPGVQATVERYISGESNAWHQLSAPIAAQAIESGFYPGNFFAWHEPAQTWVSYTNNMVWPTWADVNQQSGNFLPFHGYLVAYPYETGLNPIKVFSGELNLGDYAFTLSHSANPADDHPGFNLLGNPYASSIDWKAPAGWLGREHLSESDGGYSMWIWNDATGNYGTYHSAMEQDQGTHGVSRHIAPMQGFWVKAETDGALLAVNNPARVHSTQDWLKQQQEPQNGIRLLVHSTQSPWRDEVMLMFGHDSDLGGSEKLFSMYQAAPGLYTGKHGKKWSINLLADTEQHPLVPLGFRAGQQSTYTLEVEGGSAIDEIWLEDLFTAQVHDLKQTPSYQFTAGPAQPEDRFRLHFRAAAVGVPGLAAPMVKVYYHRGELFVINPFAETATIRVFDISGNLLAVFTASQGDNRFPFRPKPGVFVVNVYSKMNVSMEKIPVF